jgi:2-phospho-L-lactate guanylyltransferase
MRALLIPVKDLSQAKQRLTENVSVEARVALADALWQDFFELIAGTAGIDRVFVVTIEARVLERARALGWETISETRQISESDSVDFASRWCEERGITSLLRLPVDLPLIESRDIEYVFDHASAAPSLVIVPSRDEQGTNALLRTPPTLFPSRFGTGSFEKHLAEAARVRAHVTVLRNPNIGTDVDDAADVALLEGVEIRGARTREWLAAHRRSIDTQPRTERISAQSIPNFNL